MPIFASARELIGNTPLVSLCRYAKSCGANAEIIAKLEMLNPSGSAKDRAALAMIEDLELRGVITPGATLIEPTSGNTGIALAWIAKLKGYRCIIVMPDSMSEERRQLMRAYGAELVLTPGAQGMPGAIAKAESVAKERPGAIVPGQFTNPANPAAHEASTGPEIWHDTDGRVDILVAGVGTGGTVSGAGRYLKRMNPNIRIIAVEPAASPVLSGGAAVPHQIQGIGAGFLPDTMDMSIVDDVARVESVDAFAACEALAATEGLLCGISSGAALAAAATLAVQPEHVGKRIVVILPDTGERYLSSGVYD